MSESQKNPPHWIDHERTSISGAPGTQSFHLEQRQSALRILVSQQPATVALFAILSVFPDWPTFLLLRMSRLACNDPSSWLHWVYSTSNNRTLRLPDPSTTIQPLGPFPSARSRQAPVYSQPGYDWHHCRTVQPPQTSGSTPWLSGPPALARNLESARFHGTAGHRDWCWG
jgi:hypothetical protein